MEKHMTFRAPWSRKLSYSTLFFILVLFGGSMFGRMQIPRGDILTAFMISGLPLLLAGGSSLFMIRGYVVTGRAIFVQRFLWHSRIDLEGLRNVQIDPEAMSGSIRTFGNGGLFCIAGYFRSKKLGPYRAYATYPKNSVILRFIDKTIVVTPDNPEQFVSALSDIASV